MLMKINISNINKTKIYFDCYFINTLRHKIINRCKYLLTIYIYVKCKGAYYISAESTSNSIRMK